MFKKFASIIYALIILALLGLYFTNDFGIVDIQKTALVMAVGIDRQNDQLCLTAQVAVPKPSESGDNTEYTEVQGLGDTVADALNEINSKTGFFPKLLFCRLILLGESTFGSDIFELMNYFYRTEFSDLTSLVATCYGEASDLLKLKTPMSQVPSIAIQRGISEELKKSGNVTAATLKDIAISNLSPSKMCVMPYVEAFDKGTSSKAGDDKVGGDKNTADQSGSGGGQSGGDESGGSGSGGQSGGSGSGGESGGESGGSGSGGGESGQSGGSGASGAANNEASGEVDFACRKTAVYKEGKFVGILDEEQAFALNILTEETRMVVLPCEAEGNNYTLGIKGNKGGVDFKVKDGRAICTLSFSGHAEIQASETPLSVEDVARSESVSKEILDGAKKRIEERIDSLIEFTKENDVDLLKLKESLYKRAYKYFKPYEERIINECQYDYKVNITTVN